MSPDIDKREELPEKINISAAKRLIEWLRPHRRTIFINILFALVLTGVTLLVPKLLKWTIDEMVGVYQASVGLGAAEAAVLKDAAWQRLFNMLLAFVGVLAVSAVIRHFEIKRIMMFSQHFMYQMRKMFFTHLHRLGLRYYDSMKAGQIISRGTSDIDTMEHTVSWAPSHIVGAAMTLTGVIVLLLLEDWMLFLAVFPALPVLMILTRRFSSRASATWQEVRKQTGKLTANVAESIAGARVIQAFAREQKNEEIFGHLTDRLYESQIETDRIRGRFLTSIRFIHLSTSAVVILFGAYRIAETANTDDPVTTGTVVAFLAYVGMFFGPISMLSELYNDFLHTCAAASRIMEVLDTEPEIVDVPGAPSPDDFKGDIQFDHVTFEYNEGVPVLKDVSFHARPGEVIALVGPTGGGKTTICRLIARFYEAQEGKVLIDGSDVRSITQKSLHRRMGIVLQENFLFTGTVMDNIRYGRPSATDEEIVQCAQEIGSHRAIDALPEGYQTSVGERGQTLSAGQRQLVCFSRAMLANPRILILDEATSSVDTETELQIQKALKRLTEHRTSFIVAHRLSTIRQADRILVVEGGQIIEEGTHSELMNAGARYARMYMEFIRSE